MSNYEKYTPAQRKAWGKKMAAARAAKNSGTYSQRLYAKYPKGTPVPRPAITGRGAYKSTSVEKAPKSGRAIRSTARGIGGVLGTAIGGPGIGTAIGSGLGALAGEAIKYFTGYGDYKVENNALLEGGGNIDDMPPIINKSTSGTTFRKSEFICDIITSSTPGAFKIQSFPVNPGLEGTFEWLSQVAANYEEYVMEGLYFEFRSMSADALNSTNTALGQVIMAAQYNAALPNFVNKQQMENYEGGMSAKPSMSSRFFLECAKNQTILDDLYVRTGAVPSGQDQRLYDIANFQIATNGFQAANVNIGELHVCYQIGLRKPKLYAALGLYNSYATYQANSYANLTPLGSGTGAIVVNNIIGLAVDQTASTISWSPPTLPQSYNISIEWSGTAVAITAPSITYSNGLAIRASTWSPVNAVNSGQLITTQDFTYLPASNSTNSNPTITLGFAGVLPTAPAVVRFQITQIPNTVYGV